MRINRWRAAVAGLTAVLIIVTSIGLHVATPKVTTPKEVHANCCLCMCHAKDETKCSNMCISLQHGTKVVELPEMEVCTKECLRKGVEQIFSEE